jgi:hypothetical protein
MTNAIDQAMTNAIEAAVAKAVGEIHDEGNFKINFNFNSKNKLTKSQINITQTAHGKDNNTNNLRFSDSGNLEIVETEAVADPNLTVAEDTASNKPGEKALPVNQSTTKKLGAYPPDPATRDQWVAENHVKMAEKLRIATLKRSMAAREQAKKDSLENPPWDQDLRGNTFENYYSR